MMVINNAFEFGQIVYLTTDPDQRRRVVVELKVSPNGVLYRLSCGTTDSDHYECEISTEIDVLAKTE